MNGNGFGKQEHFHNHPKLGKAISNIIQRLDKIEEALKIIRGMTPDIMWNLYRNKIIEAENIQKELDRIYKKAEELELGNFTDI